jgi:hypothetical protein
MAHRRNTFTGRPAGPVALNRSPYLLAGLACCAVCQGPLISATRTNGNGRARVYQCGYHQKRGKSVCSNGVALRQEVLDAALLDTVSAALDRRVIEATVDEAFSRLQAHEAPSTGRRSQIERDLAVVEARKGRLVDAIARESQ